MFAGWSSCPFVLGALIGLNLIESSPVVSRFLYSCMLLVFRTIEYRSQMISNEHERQQFIRLCLPDEWNTRRNITHSRIFCNKVGLDCNRRSLWEWATNLHPIWLCSLNELFPPDFPLLRRTDIWLLRTWLLKVCMWLHVPGMKTPKHYIWC